MYRKSEYFLFDILISILKIEEYIKDFQNAEELKFDPKSWDATIRELEIIGEATKHLINLNIFSKEKREIVDFRNIIVHHYFGIDEEIVWDILTNHLSKLKNEVIKKIDNLKNKKELFDIFIEDNKNIKFLKEKLKELK